jgi:hypothetical protein
VRGKALGAGGFIGFAAGLVKAEFDDGDVGVGWREVVVEFGLGEVEFNLVEGFERVAEVDQDQVALVAELGEERGLAGRRLLCVPVLQSAETASAAMRSRSPARSGAPGLPVEAEELVEQAEPSRVSGTGGKSDNGSTSITNLLHNGNKACAKARLLALS